MRTYVPIIQIMLAAALVTVARWAGGQGPQSQSTPSRGVRCPTEFTAIWDPANKVLRCRRDVVSWVVTACPDKGFATYQVKSGEDACGPTEIPGVGTPPGSKGTKTVSCAAPGYTLMTDRTGDRDRCEKTERIFALPLPAS